MRSSLTCSRSLVVAIGLLFFLSNTTICAQSLVATVAVSGGNISAIAVNGTTNKIYTAGANAANTASSLSVIDGATNLASAILTKPNPYAQWLLVNPATNKVYNGSIYGSGTEPAYVIDGATNAVTPLAGLVLNGSTAAALNPVTNKIYVVNGANLAVIDGATDTVTNIPIPTLANGSYWIAVNPATNKIYITAFASPTNDLTIVDGASNGVTTVSLEAPNDFTPYAKHAVAVNPVTNRIYVGGFDGMIVLDGTNNTKLATISTTASNYALGQESQIAVNTATNTIYAAGRFVLEIVNGATNTAGPATINSPGAIGLNTVSGKAYVAATFTGLETVDASSNVSTLPLYVNGPLDVNSAPNRVYAASSNGLVYVIDSGSALPAAPYGSTVAPDNNPDPAPPSFSVSWGATASVPANWYGYMLIQDAAVATPTVSNACLVRISATPGVSDSGMGLLASNTGTFIGPDLRINGTAQIQSNTQCKLIGPLSGATVYSYSSSLNGRLAFQFNAPWGGKALAIYLAGSATASSPVGPWVRFGTFTAPPNAPGNFTVSAAPVTVFAPATSSSAIAINATGGFNNTVSIVQNGWPAGIDGYYPPGSGSMSIFVTGTVAPGNYTLPIVATSAQLSASASIALTVGSASGTAFSLSAGPALYTPTNPPLTVTSSVPEGQVASSVITANPISGFTGAITYTQGSWPAGFSSVPGGIQVALGTAPGNYSLPITGTSGGHTATTSIPITVSALPHGVAVSPSAGAGPVGTAQNLQFTWASQAGELGMAWADLLIQDATSGQPSDAPSSAIFSNSCFIRIVNTGALQLADDAGLAQANNYAGASYALTQSNSQCTLNGTASQTPSFTNGNTNLQEALNLTFNSAWAGKTLKIWLRGTSVQYLTSGWKQFGTFTVSSATIPNFTLSATSPTTLQGGTATANITITPQNGFSSPVTLAAASAWPAGITGAFAPNPATTSSVLTLTVPSTITPGTYSLPILGTSGTLVNPLTVSLTVNTAGSFTFSAAPATVTIPSAGYAMNATSALTITASGGFNQSVTFSPTGWPANFYNFSYSANSGVSTIYFTVDPNTPAGTYSLGLTGVSGQLTATASTAVTVINPYVGSSFSLSSTGTTVAAGASNNLATVTVNPIGAFSSYVLLAATNWPAGIAGYFQPLATGTTPVSIGVSSSVAPGAYNLLVTGTSGSLTATTTIALTVTPGLSSYTLNPTPAIAATPGSGSTATIGITANGAFNSAVTLATRNWPAGITGAFTPNPATTASAVAINVAAGVAPGTYSLDVTGNSTNVPGTTDGVASIILVVTTTTNNGLPRGVSVTPPSASGPAGTAQNLQFVWATPSGQPAMAWGELLIQDSATASPSTANACYIRVNAGGSVLLADDTSAFGSVKSWTGNSWSASQANAHCSLNGPASQTVSSTNGGANLASTLNLTFDPSWTGKTLSVWMQGTNTNYQPGVWQSFGTFTVAGAPSFALSATSASIPRGSFGASLVSITPANGFSAAVGLTASNWPSGITGVFFTNPATASSIVSISVGPTVAAGSYTLNIIGVSGAIRATTTIALTVTGTSPTFTLSATSATIAAGASGPSTVTIAPANGFNSGVTLSAPNWPSGITGTFGTNPATTGSSTVTINVASSVAAGSYTLPINGASGSLNASTTIALTVTASGGSNGMTVTPPTGAATVNTAQNLVFNWNTATPLAWGEIVIQDSANSSVTLTNACYLRANGTGSILLGDDNGSLTNPNNWVGYPWALSQSNTQCTLNGQASQFATSASGIQATLNLAFKPAWTGKTLSLWMRQTTASYVSGNWQQVGTITVGGGSPSFTMSASNATIAAGASGTSTVTITPANGFNSGVTLSTSSWPSGITGAFGTNPATGSSTATINVASSVAAGSYTLTVNGVSGSLNASASIALTVTGPTPSFTMSASSASIAAGASGTSTVTITPANGFNSGVTLSTSSWPSGITATFGTNPATGSSTVTINVTSSVAPGPYTLTITGVSGSLNTSATIGLTVTAASNGGGSNGMTVTPSAGTATVNTAQNLVFNWNTSTPLAWGEVVIQDSANSSATLTNACYLRANGTGSILLADDNGSLTNPNNWVGYPWALSQSNTQCTLNGQASQFATSASGIQATLNLAFKPAWTGKTLSLWMRQTNASYLSGTWQQVGSITVGGGSPSFTMSASNATIATGGSGASTVTITPANGFNSAVTLSPSNWPNGITGTFVTNPAVTGSSTVTINVASSVAAGPYTLAVNGVSGSLNASTTIALTVTGATPSFTMSVSNATIATGGSGASTVTITPANGFNSAVTLSAFNWPSGITGTFGTNPAITGSSTVTINVTSSVAAGPYTLAVNGVSGSLNASATIALTVSAAGGGSNGMTVTPSAGTATVNTPQNLVFNWNAAAPLAWGEVVIQDSANSSATLTNACNLRANGTGSILLGDDNGSLTNPNNWVGYPWALSQSNTQCTLNGQASQFVSNASGIQATLNLAFKPAWAGKTLSIWMRQTNANYVSGTWQQVGSITVQ